MQEHTRASRSTRRGIGATIAVTTAILGALLVAPIAGGPVSAETVSAQVTELQTVELSTVEVSTVRFETTTDPGEVAPIVDDSRNGAVRSRFATVDVDQLTADLGGDDVSIELFDDVVIPFEATGELAVGEGGHPTWSATMPDTVATLSFAPDGVRGSVSVGGTTYSIIPAHGSTHLIFEEGRSFPNENEAGDPPPEFMNDAPGSAEPSLFDPAPSVAADGATPVVRVLTVYDDFTRSYFGGDAGAIAALVATIDEVNAAYVRSGANLTMESASIEHMPYVSAFVAGGDGSGQTDLQRITSTSDGYLDAVHARRDTVGADLVVLIARLNSGAGGSCGIAWTPVRSGSGYDSRSGFSVADTICAKGNLTYAHETAHNLGAGHGNGDGDGVTPYANGYRNAPAGYRTIMAYNANTCAGGVCTRVAHFSSPSALYTGQPTGSATQDNARVLSELAPFVAGYRSGGGPSGGTGFQPLTPARLLDTRGGAKAGSFDGSVGPVVLNVLGKGGLPGSGVGALALNVTVAEGENPVAGGGFVTVYQCGTRPNASNLNFVGGQTIPNSVIAPVSASGDVCFYVYGRAHLLVDVSGYFPSGSGISSLTPARLLDTRSGAKAGSFDGSVGPVVLNVLGKGGLPGSGVGALALNVTVAEGENPVAGGGFVTVYQCGTRPNASNLNFVGGQTIPNSVIAPVSASGDVCFYVYGRAHLLVDVSGYFPSGSGISSLTPARLLDTRSGAKAGSFDGSVGPVVLNVLGKGGLPGSGVGALALNVTVAEGENPVAGGGFVTVYQCGTRPNASNLNFVGGQTIPNSVIAPVSASGDVCFYVYGRAHLLVDVSGYFPS